MRNISEVKLVFKDDDLQFHFNFDEGSVYYAHSEPVFKDDKEKKKYEQELENTILNIVKVLSSVC